MSKYEIAEGFLYNISLFGKEYIYGITIFIPIIVFLLNILTIAVLILFSSEDTKKDAIVAIIYLASIASTLSVSFSPTIYASIPRIFFVSDLLMLAVIGIMTERLLNKKEQ